MLRRKNWLIYVFSIAGFLIFRVGEAALINADSCSKADVQIAVDAAHDGDIVQIPPGTCDWSSPVTVQLSTGAGRALTIQGAGVAPDKGAANKTIIKISSESSAFKITGISDKKFRITNIKFLLGGGYDGLIYVNGSSKPSSGGGFRIDHNTFGDSAYPLKTRAFKISGNTYGVIDNNIGIVRYQFGLVQEHNSGNPSWNREISVGTSNAVYVEDNSITNVDIGGRYWMFCDGDNGARIVIRHNNINSLYIGGHDASSVGRGIFSYEVYNNTIDMSLNLAGGSDPMFILRGGTNIVFNNTMNVSGSPLWASPIILSNYRSLSKWGYISPWGDSCDSNIVKICTGKSVGPRICTSDGNCGGESGSCQPIDGNLDGSGYPCRDQIGFTSLGNSQIARYPSLFWNNKYKGSYTAPVVRKDNKNQLHIQNNRDFCHHQTSMPLTCGGIPSSYSPYTYPHPLRIGTGPNSDNLIPPNLRIISAVQ